MDLTTQERLNALYQFVNTFNNTHVDIRPAVAEIKRLLDPK